ANGSDHHNMPLRLSPRYSFNQREVHTLIDDTKVSYTRMGYRCLISRICVVKSRDPVMVCVDTTWERMNVWMPVLLRLVQTVSTRKSNVGFSQQLTLAIFHCLRCNLES